MNGVKVHRKVKHTHTKQTAANEKREEEKKNATAEKKKIESQQIWPISCSIEKNFMWFFVFWLLLARAVLGFFVMIELSWCTVDAVTKIHKIEIDFFVGISHAIHGERTKQLANHTQRETKSARGWMVNENEVCNERKLQQKQINTELNMNFEVKYKKWMNEFGEDNDWIDGDMDGKFTLRWFGFSVKSECHEKKNSNELMKSWNAQISFLHALQYIRRLVPYVTM